MRIAYRQADETPPAGTMKIEAIETSTFRVPLARPWGDQTHRVTDIEVVVTEITSDSGLVGTGFSYSVGMGGKAIEALLTWYLAPYVIGADVAPGLLWNRMWHHAHDAGGGGSHDGVARDIALWDLVCKGQEGPW
jgi:L-alanine-DL-glutamate epimerase-like enolase superfamily enzyme